MPRIGVAIVSCVLAVGLGPSPNAPAVEQEHPSGDDSSLRCPESTAAVELGGVAACRVEVRFPSGELTLAGEWFHPRAEGRFPAVVFVRGSGESTRGNPWTESFAGTLVGSGMGVLIPDKRGSVESEGDWRTADFGDLADDARAAVRHLAARPDVDPERIGLLGLSQGGQIVPVAAAESDSLAFVINVVGGAVPFIENVRYEMLNTFREEGLAGRDLESAMGMVDTAVGYVRSSVEWDSYVTALEETRAVLGEEITDAYFIRDPEHWRWAFFRRMADFDPVDWWSRVDVPVLVLLGEADPNTDSAETARRLREVFEDTGQGDSVIRVFEGLDHTLWDMSGPMREHGLDPEVRRSLEDWVARVVVDD